jgi:hypothetical protein
VVATRVYPDRDRPATESADGAKIRLDANLKPIKDDKGKGKASPSKTPAKGKGKGKENGTGPVNGGVTLHNFFGRVAPGAGSDSSGNAVAGPSRIPAPAPVPPPPVESVSGVPGFGTKDLRDPERKKATVSTPCVLYHSEPSSWESPKCTKRNEC